MTPSQMITLAKIMLVAKKKNDKALYLICKEKLSKNIIKIKNEL